MESRDSCIERAHTIPGCWPGPGFGFGFSQRRKFTGVFRADPHGRSGIRAFLMSTVTAPGESLLAQPPSARLQYFKDFAVAHPLLVEAKDRVLEAITQSAPNSLIILSGPTGVGKTTLLKKIQQLLCATALEEGAPDPALLPVVTVEATPPESGSFSWRTHL